MLLDDICRCLDADCSERTDCRRWTERLAGGNRVVHAMSLYPPQLLGPDGTQATPCPNRIPVSGYRSVALDLEVVGA